MDLFSMLEKKNPMCRLCETELYEFEISGPLAKPGYCSKCSSKVKFIERFRKLDSRILVFNGDIYHDMQGINPPGKVRTHKGFGGREFKISFTNDFIAETEDDMMARGCKIDTKRASTHSMFIYSDDVFLVGKVPQSIESTMKDNCIIYPDPRNIRPDGSDRQYATSNQ